MSRAGHIPIPESYRLAARRPNGRQKPDAKGAGTRRGRRQREPRKGGESQAETPPGGPAFLAPWPLVIRSHASFRLSISQSQDSFNTCYAEFISESVARWQRHSFRDTNSIRPLA